MGVLGCPLADAAAAELVSPLGPRKHLQAALADLEQTAGPADAAGVSPGTVNSQDISCTAYIDPMMILACCGPLFSGRRLPRLCMVTYTSSGRRRRGGWGDDDDDASKAPPGTPLLMLELHNCMVRAVGVSCVLLWCFARHR